MAGGGAKPSFVTKLVDKVIPYEEPKDEPVGRGDLDSARHHSQQPKPQVLAPGEVFQSFLAILLLLIIGCAVAPSAAVHEGWAYYHHDNIAFPGYQGRPAVPNMPLRIWVGWKKGHDSYRSALNAVNPSIGEYTPLQDIKKSGQILAAFTIGWLDLSALVALIYLLVWIGSSLTRQRWHARHQQGKAVKPYRKARVPLVSQAVWPFISLFFGLTNGGLVIANYIVLAVGVSIYTRQNLGEIFIAWPDWAFFVGLGSSLFWLMLATVTIIETFAVRARRSKMTGGLVSELSTKAPHHQAPYHHQSSGPMHNVQHTGHQNNMEGIGRGRIDENEVV